MKIRTILLALLLLSAASVAAQPMAAFQNGEKLEFIITYRAALIPNSEVAEVTLTTSNQRLNGESTFRIVGKARVKPFFRWFFDLNDTYETWLDPATLRPLKATADLSEGNYRFTRTILFDWQAMQANTTYRNRKWSADRTQSLTLKPRSFDALALFYNLRSQPRDRFVQGERRTLQLVSHDTTQVIGYRFLGREEKSIKGLGRFHPLKFSCQLTTSDGKQFEDGSEFFIWLSDDDNMIPLYIESPIRVGSIQGTLKRYNNLKYPLESRSN